MNIFARLVKRIQNSIINKFILVFIFGGMVPVLILSGWTALVSYRAGNMYISGSVYQILKEKIDFSVLRLKEIESLIANISGVEDISTALSQEDSLQNSYDKLRLQAKIGYILNGYINIEGLESIDIFSYNGNRYHVGESLVTDNQNFKPILKQLISENKNAQRSIVWHGVLPNLDKDNHYSLTATKELVLIDPETMTEKPVGILIVQFSVDVFNSKFDSIKREDFSYVILDNKNNCILPIKTSEIGTHFFSAHKILNKSLEDNFVHVTLDKQKVFQLKYMSEFNNWTYYAFLSTNYINDLTSEFTKGTFLIMVLFFLLTLLLNGIFLQYLLVPVKNITRIFAEISENRYDLTKQLPNPHTDEVGDLIKWFNAFTSNLVEKEHYQAELKVQKELAEKANHAKDIFLASISHELRTPLNGVISVAELLYDTNLDPVQHGYTKTILDSGEILYLLINQILDFSKISADKLILSPYSFDFLSLSDKLANLYSVQSKIKNIVFTYQRPEPESLHILGDKVAIQKIIINLLGNSLKFTSEGEILFRIRLSYPTDDRVKISITVADTGIGIPLDKQQVIFNAFEQVDNSLSKTHSGTGLGLAIAQQLSKLMGSKIELISPSPDFENAPHPGSSFSLVLELPISESIAENEIPGVDSIQPLLNHTNPLTALIVDDNPMNQAVLSSVLAKYNITCDIASGWMECLNFLSKNTYNYIFMDIQMPEMNGFDLTIKVREFQVQTPIIALTGNALKEVEEQAILSGMNDFMIKPIRIKELEKILIKFFPHKEN